MKELRVEMYKFTGTVDMMDEFEGIGKENKIIYDRLVIHNVELMESAGNGCIYNYALVVERGNNKAAVGNMTMTHFKEVYLNRYVSEVKEKGNKKVLLREHLNNEINEDVYNKYVNSGKVYKFSAPYKLRAQCTRNRTGYGNIYYGDCLMHEGTKYGATGNYYIIGVYIYADIGYLGNYKKQWGKVKPMY